MPQGSVVSGLISLAATRVPGPVRQIAAPTAREACEGPPFIGAVSFAPE